MREFTVVDPNGHCYRIGHGERSIAEIPDFSAGKGQGAPGIRLRCSILPGVG